MRLLLKLSSVFLYGLLSDISIHIDINYLQLLFSMKTKVALSLLFSMKTKVAFATFVFIEKQKLIPILPP
jgi:hypothetical protein